MTNRHSLRLSIRWRALARSVMRRLRWSEYARRLHNACCATIDAVLIRMRRRMGPEVFRELQRREWCCGSAP
jgi:hypothetical protein